MGVDHRHRTLYASIETSVRYLDNELDLLSRLWLFHAPFFAKTAAIFDPVHENTKEKLLQSTIGSILSGGVGCWRVKREQFAKGKQFYRVLPTIRPYIEKYLRAEEREPLLAGLEHYARLVRYLNVS